MLEAAVDALGLVLQPERLAFMMLGVGVGLLMGLLPGLSGLTGMAILLPFTFGMDPSTGIALLIGMAAVTSTSDTFPAVLIGVPGSGGSQATILDGHPLAKQGRAVWALGASFSASMIGGVIGGFALLFIINIAKPLVLALGSAELFMLCLLGLSFVAILSRGSMRQGIVSACVGLILGSMGGAPMVAEYRFDFGQTYLYGGVSIAIIALGLYALPEIFGLLIANRPISESGVQESSWRDLFGGLRETLRHKRIVLQSALIGTGVGILPGLGGSVTDWMAYGIAQRTVKNAETFGTGDIRGVIAPETANNAKEGGTMVPTLLFGIPGSGTTAVLLGGLTLMGLTPGPSMITTDLHITLSVVWLLVLGNVAACFACLAMTRPLSKMSVVPPKLLAPFLFVVLVGAAYQTTNNWGDIWLLLFIAVIGFFMRELGWPRPPALIGFVLSLPVERYFFRSLELFGPEFVLRPGVVIIGVFMILLLFGGALRARLRSSMSRPGEQDGRSADDQKAQRADDQETRV